uniref:Uncharacterized protein n=1 Tax=Globisporangium ultimum (strain ATCC 200006 / CBS 805.95 / DAOM BR144) TaxID=431595 RepID=K3X4V9_GLOUD
MLLNAVILLVVSLVLVALVSLVVWPIEKLCALLLSSGGAVEATLRAFRYTTGSMIPYFLVTACRYCNVAMFENAFFAGLATRDPDLAAAIRQKKAIYWDWEYARHIFFAGLRQLGFGLVALLAAPVLGILVPIFRFGYRIRNMETIFWIPVFVAFCVPATRSGALQVMHLWMDARGIIRELYDPIIARLKSAHSESLSVAGDDKDTTDERTKRMLTNEWHHGRSDAARLGFAIVFGCLLQLPFVGPLTWFLGFVSAGMFAPELIELQSFARHPKTDKAL